MKTPVKFLLRALLLQFFLVHIPLCAGVNLKNGNFYISYTDLNLGASDFLKSIVRTYNSKSTYVGIFGFGWGSKCETFIAAYPDNTIILNEHGGGNAAYFSTDFILEEKTDEMIETLVQLDIRNGKLKNTPSEILALKKKLKNNLEARTTAWNKYVEKGDLQYSTNIPESLEWTEARGYGIRKITKTKDGFILNDANNKEYYNLEGKLVKLENNNGENTRFEYQNGRLSKIISGNGETATITTNKDGFITKISTASGEAIYQYDGKKLIKSIDPSNNIYEFEYDPSYNMTGIRYDDGTTLKISYYPDTMFVKSITERNGETREYQYITFYNPDGSEKDDHYGTKVIKTDPYSEKKIENYYEYEIRTKPDGDRFTYKIITEVNGFRTTQVFDEICTNNLLSITKGNQTTDFKYNSNCNLVEKRTASGEVIKMEYDPRFQKITKVTNADGTTLFNYDDKGNLIKAVQNDTTWIKLVYEDTSNRISQLESDNGTLLFFEYNSGGKPVKIDLKDREGTGTLKVDYDDHGDIEKVDSPEGHQMSLKITQTFQTLLQLVKPSGVNLNFF